MEKQMSNYGYGSAVTRGRLPSFAIQNRVLAAYERKYLQARGQVVQNMRAGRWRYVQIWQRYIHTIQIKQIQAARRFNRKARLAVYIRRLYTSPYRQLRPPQTPYAPLSYYYPRKQYQKAPNPGAQQNYLVAAGLAGLGNMDLGTGGAGIL